MLNSNCGRTPRRKWLISALAVLLVFNLLGCEQPQLPEASAPSRSTPQATPPMAEVSPPRAIQFLHQPLDVYQPQVSILSPQPDEILQDNTVTVQLQVQDLAIFRDETLGLGPHLQVILDNQPLKDIYSLDEPLVLSDLEAGTHTLQIFAAYPWKESFKNDGAYAQTTFHIFTKTPENNPNPQLPLLTYNQPTGTYGAEPVLLDFYLTNAPLHLVAQENPEDEIVDWRIRVTVNGESFIIDRWQPIYIKGIKPGKNWVQLEYLDELGEPLTNVYNNTARVFTYDPQSQDTLSKLVRGELTIASARPIVDPGYDTTVITPEVEETPEEIEILPEVEETSEPEEILQPVEILPSPEETLEEIEILPEVEETSEPEETLQPGEILPEVEEQPATSEPVEPLTLEDETETIETVPAIETSPTLQETSSTPVEDVLPPAQEEIPPPEPSPTAQTEGWFNRIKGQIQQLPVFQKNNSQTRPLVPTSETSEPAETDNLFKRIFSRFQQNTSELSSPQTLPEMVDEVPVPEPTQPVLEPEQKRVPDEFEPTSETIEAETPVIEPETLPEIIDQTPEVEPEVNSQAPVIIEPEPEPETLPEIIDQTPEVEPEVNSQAPVIIEPEPEPETLPEIIDETSVLELETELEDS